MPNDAHHAILGQRAGGPRLFPMFREPVMRRVVLDMRGVNQRDEHVYVEQESHPGNSSRNWFTSSGVTAAAPARTGSRGTPLRALPFCALGRSAFRVSSEITSPILLCCNAARLFAAASTSSSMERVVRILHLMKLTSNITHHTSGKPSYQWHNSITLLS